MTQELARHSDIGFVSWDISTRRRMRPKPCLNYTMSFETLAKRFRQFAGHLKLIPKQMRQSERSEESE